MSSSNITQIRQEYEQKVKEIKDLMKNPSMDIENFSNDTSFQDKNLTFAASGCINSNNSTCIEKYPIKGYPYKRGVKLSFGENNDYEPRVEAGGDDLYGICIDIDDYTQIATVVPITEKFEGYLVAKDNSIKCKDKLKFNSDGQLEKANGSSNTNAVAITDSIKITDNLHMVGVKSYGNKALN